MSNIRLSPKHGVNPSLSVCFLCQEEKNEILLLGMLKGDQEAPRKAVFNMEPCDACKEWMLKGVIVISVRNGEMSKDKDNPYRTGGWCVVTSDAINRMPIPDKLKASVITKRVVFIEDDVWDKMGLPREASV